MASTDAQPVRGDAVSQAKVAPKRYPFWLGGVSASIAVLFTHPLDLTKLRMQNAPQKTTTLRLLRNTIQNEGVRGLYIGISASVLRQMTYSLTRFAAYEKIKERFIANRRGPPPLWITITTAGFAGAAGGLAGNPADVILVRMTGDMYRPPEQRFNYRGAANGLARITKEEGLHTLFRGLAPNMVRAALMNSSQLASYVAGRVRHTDPDMTFSRTCYDPRASSPRVACPTTSVLPSSQVPWPRPSARLPTWCVRG